MIYLPIDTETGGIGLETSLLTTYMAAIDSTGKVIEELDLKVKSPKQDDSGNSVYSVTGTGLAVNKINIIEHDQSAQPWDICAERVEEFLRENSLIELGDGIITKERLTPIGHNVAFDISRMMDLVGSKVWGRYVSYRVIDTAMVARFLMDCGKIPEGPASLSALCSLFDIRYDAHTAKGDALATFALYQELRRIGRGI